jgi:hypothetical protein
MTESVKIRKMVPGEESEVCDLVKHVSHDHTAVQYAQ